MSLLEVRGVTKRFGGLVAVNDVDFGLKEGEIMGLIGPNGSGKTTLFNCIAGFYRPEAGDIRFRGESLTRRLPHEICMKGVARTFQIVKPFIKMTVLENVMIGAFSRTKDTEEAKEEARGFIDLVGLTNKMKLPASDLTLADQKSLELARVLATKPKLLLLDEVVAGLNQTETDEMIDVLRKVNKMGITMIIIEHVMRAIMTLAGRIVVLHHGSKIAEGPPREIAGDKEVIEAYLGREYHA